jgi:hypothetical protein
MYASHGSTPGVSPNDEPSPPEEEYPHAPLDPTAADFEPTVTPNQIEVDQTRTDAAANQERKSA